MLPCVGGLGYLALGQYRKSAVLAGITAALLTLDILAASQGLLEDGAVLGWVVISMVLTPAWFSILALGALDAWLLARAIRSQGSIARNETRVPVLSGWLGHMESEIQNG